MDQKILELYHRLRTRIEALEAGIVGVGVDIVALEAQVNALDAANSQDVTIGTANGLSLAGQVLSNGLASAVAAGAVGLGAQTLGSGTKTVDAMVVSGTLTVDGTTVVVDSGNDRFGVRTATPASVVDIYDAANSNSIFRVYDTASAPALQFGAAVVGRDSSSAAANYPSLKLGSSAQAVTLLSKNSAIGDRPCIVLGDGTSVGGAVEFNGYRHIKDDGTTTGLAVTTKGSSNSAVNRLTFTGNAATAAVAVVNADFSVGATVLVTDVASSRVGLNVAPARILDVRNNVSTASPVGITNTSTSGFSALALNDNSASAKGFLGYGNASVAATHASRVYVEHAADLAFLRNSAGITLSALVPASTGIWDFASIPTVSSVAVVTLSASQTLTSKTLTSPTINAATISGTFGGAATFSGNLTLSGANSLSGVQTFGDINVHSNAPGITAFAGGGQASATALAKELNFVTTVASANDSVRLPGTATGKRLVVHNRGANSLDIFPASGGAIDGLGTNNPYQLAAGAARVFEGQTSTQWYSR